MWHDLQTWLLNPDHILALLHILILALGGFWLTRIFCRFLERRMLPHLGSPVSDILAKAIRYLLYTILLANILGELGFKLTAVVGAVLGAAGVAGVAFGFAAQTSLSNFISGLFLVWERPFKTGEVIEIDGSTGVVHSIGFLSTSLRTFDNRIVRIPNETLVKGRITNHTRLPTRRVDLTLSVSHQADPQHVIRLLAEIAAAHPKCLHEPKPVVVFQGLSAASMNFLLGAWGHQEDLATIQNELLCAIKQRFDAEGIALPSQQFVLAPGPQPLAVRLAPN
jgi:small-conductance mechanosensitive channel